MLFLDASCISAFSATLSSSFCRSVFSSRVCWFRTTSWDPVFSEAWLSAFCSSTIWEFSFANSVKSEEFCSFPLCTCAPWHQTPSAWRLLQIYMCSCTEQTSIQNHVLGIREHNDSNIEMPMNLKALTWLSKLCRWLWPSWSEAPSADAALSVLRSSSSLLVSSCKTL